MKPSLLCSGVHAASHDSAFCRSLTNITCLTNQYHSCCTVDIFGSWMCEEQAVRDMQTFVVTDQLAKTKVSLVTVYKPGSVYPAQISIIPIPSFIYGYVKVFLNSLTLYACVHIIFKTKFCCRFCFACVVVSLLYTVLLLLLNFHGLLPCKHRPQLWVVYVLT